MIPAAGVASLSETLAHPPPAPTPEIGWFCTYTPEELLLAAGLTPRRLRGGCQPIRSADAHLHNNLCPYVRSTLDAAIHHEEAPVAGVITVASCDSMRRLHDAWCAQFAPAFAFLLSMPRLSTEAAVDFAAAEFRALCDALGAYVGQPIGDEALATGIATMNGMRATLREIAALHVDGYAAVSASDMATSVDAAMRWPKVAFTERVGDWAAAVRAEQHPRPRSGPRILVAGGILDHAYIMELVEDLGGQVPADDLCTGSRYYGRDVQVNGDPLRALAERQLQRSSCARMRDTEGRVRALLAACDRHRIDGVIYYTIKFCDPHLFDLVPIEQALRATGIPVLRWESDHTMGARGQMRTRVEAFLEMLQ